MGGNKKVIIIEDEKPLARALELKLTHEGFEVKIATNGEEGLALLEKETFDIILLDLVMPKIDGFQVLSTLREKGITTPVLVLSNLSQTEDEKRVRELGAAGFFIKSNTPLAQIVEMVKKGLNMSA